MTMPLSAADDALLQRGGTMLVMAGGTGGHVFPGLAVARCMAEAGWRIVWLGSATGMEAGLVPQHGFPIEFVRFGGVRGKGWRTKLLAPFKLVRACGDAWRVLRRVQPNVVLGMGGYITFPAGLISVLTGRPLVLHEQNSIAGMANRVLSKVASRTLVAFPEALPDAQWTGNPVRSDVTAVAPPAERFAGRSGPLRLLVVGGSLGAAALNETVPRALAKLPPESRPHVVHQSGARHLDALRRHYADAGLIAAATAPDVATAAAATQAETNAASVDLRAFIDDMASAYAQADVVICRAGAMTVAEIAAIGAAALFVPFPSAVDDHQTTNGRFLSDAGAADLIQQRALSADALAAWISGLTRAGLLDMAQKARALAKPDATRQVALACAQAARHRGGNPRNSGGQQGTAGRAS